VKLSLFRREPLAMRFANRLPNQMSLQPNPQQPLLLEENDIQDVAPQQASKSPAGSSQTHPKTKLR
jgi:hypothetical protein